MFNLKQLIILKALKDKKEKAKSEITIETTKKAESGITTTTTVVNISNSKIKNSKIGVNKEK